MSSQIVFERIALVLLGVLGPILCYVIVYGFFGIIRVISIKIKSRRFKKRMEIANANKEKDEFDDIDDIEVDVVTSIERNEEEENG